MPDLYIDLHAMTERVLAGAHLDEAEGLWLAELPQNAVPQLMAGADRIRRHFLGEAVEVCGIANVRSGNCSENCRFCSQSGHYTTSSEAYDFIPVASVLMQGERLQSQGATDFGLVSKGWGLRTEKEKNKLTEYLTALKEANAIGRCASLGPLDRETAQVLKAAGLENYHHNLECAESFFDAVCTTHSYAENIETVKNAKEAGFRVCAGGILGMGESLAQRVELALTLRDLAVESVPLNFLSPQAGTPMAEVSPMAPMEILHTIALYRFLLPAAEIRIAGGRTHLRDLQPMIFFAGASGFMIGDYLTTAGRKVADDMAMLRDLGLHVRGDTPLRRERARQQEGQAA